MKDGRRRIFNCAADSGDVPENLKALYDYIRTGKVGGDLTQRMDQAVYRARENEEWRSEYMKELLHDDDVREEGRFEGENQFVMLISRMNAGGDTDKIAQLDEPEMLFAMRRKYGLE